MLVLSNWIPALLLTTGILTNPISDFIGRVINDQYIVVFKNDIETFEIDQHWKWLQDLLSPLVPATNILSIQNDVRKDYYFSKNNAFDAWGILHRFDLPDFRGYSIRIPSFVAKLLERHNSILYVEPDVIMKISKIQEKSPSWGINRICSRTKQKSATYEYPDTAGGFFLINLKEGINAYVIDTGIFVDHPEFEGRARFGKSFSPDGALDGNGHGTHVAGTIGSKTYGVAKKVNLIAVKVLDAQGSGSTSQVYLN
jgi:hypothetical protein